MNFKRYINNVFRAVTNTPRTSNRKYEGASRSPRTSNFPLNNLSPNKDIGQDATILRQRAKYLYQNTIYAKRAINALANGVVGTGIMPNFRTSSKRGEAGLKKGWADWAETKKCDFNGRLTMYGLQKLITKTYLRDGEVLVMRRRVPVTESPNGLQLQVLEMEYLADYINYQILPGGGWTYNGIEYDHRGKVVAYWLFHRHPSEWYTFPVRHPASEILHILNVDYPAQNRGVPSGATTIIEENELDMYEDAELVAKKVQASHAVFRVTNDPEKMEDPPNADDYDKSVDLEKLEPGTIYHLFPGESIQSNTPPTASGTEDYRKSKQRNIAVGYEVTYEMLTGDYSQVNFSSGRMGWVEHSRTLDHIQNLTIIPQFIKPVMDWFLEQIAVTPGMPREAINLSQSFGGGDLNITWTPPRREMLDPTKETMGLKNMLRTGMISLSEVIQSQGRNPEEVLSQIAKDEELCAKLGLHLEWSPNLDINIASPKELQGQASRSLDNTDDIKSLLQELIEKIDHK